MIMLCSFIQNTLANAKDASNSKQQFNFCYENGDIYPMTEDTRNIRLRRLIPLVDKADSKAEFARRHNIDATYLAQILNGHRNIGEKSARKLESSIGLPPFYLDREDQSVDTHVEGQILPNVTTTIMRNVPLISWVMAGNFCEAIDNFHANDAEEWIPTDYAVRAHTYALRVVGDSMTPDFPEGTVLIVEPTEDLRHGRYVIAKRGNDVTFKQAVQDGTKWYLKPLNNAYPTVELTEETTICGIVVETLARRKTI